MKIKNILDECFQDYKKTSMFIAVDGCDWKCCREAGIPVTACQNNELSKQNSIDINIALLVDRYINNNITTAVIFAGLEPMLQINDILLFIEVLRNQYFCEDDVVIYTGYYPEEVEKEIQKLKQYKNIIVKFGRYIPDRPSRYDDVLGISLISDNQYAIKIS